MSRYEERRGLLLPAETQAALTLAHATMAKRRAEKLAQQGVPPVLAADRAYLSTTAVLAWLFFVAPVMGFSYLATLLTVAIAPLGLVVWAPEALLCTVISIRVLNYQTAPADRTLVYRIPTVAIICAFALWTMLAFTLVLIGFLIRSP